MVINASSLLPQKVIFQYDKGGFRTHQNAFFVYVKHVENVPEEDDWENRSPLSAVSWKLVLLASEAHGVVLRIFLEVFLNKSQGYCSVS